MTFAKAGLAALVIWTIAMGDNPFELSVLVLLTYIAMDVSRLVGQADEP